MSKPFQKETNKTDHESRMKSAKNNKREDEAFPSKKIKHDPQAESARSVFGLKSDPDQKTK